MGRATTRAESHRAFGTRGAGWVPPDKATVLAVLRRMLRGQAVHGTTRRYASAASLVAAGRRRLKSTDAVFVAATCRLHTERVTARHAFLVTGYETGSLQILDSLGRAPMSAHPSNASISSSGTRRRFVRVAGACWDLGLAHPIALMQRSP